MAEVKCWAIGTGRISIIRKASRKAARYLSKQKGFIGVHVLPDGTGRTLWLFDSENNAKLAKNHAEGIGILCGKYIAEVFVDKSFLENGKDN